MQTASLYAGTIPLSGKQPVAPADSVRASVSHLLSRACAVPCKKAAEAFTELVQPLSRFPLCLEMLWPLLNSHAPPAQRILASYILYSLYAPHPFILNPFKGVLFAAFCRERELARQVANAGGISENEQLVWVLWKILKGDGQDIDPFSPSTLARSPLPPQLRATNLYLDEETLFSCPPFIQPVISFGDSASDNTGPTPADVTSSTQAAPDVADSREREEETKKLSDAMTLLLAARNRVLTISEQRMLIPLIPQLTSPPVITSVDLLSVIMNNPTLAQPLLTALLALPPSSTNGYGPGIYLDVLQHLPPTLPSFDLLGRLLRDPTAVPDVTTGGTTTIADLVRTEVLGWFIHECIVWLDKAEQEEREGAISDDRFAKGVQHLCRFYSSLIKHSIVDTGSDADSAEMAHFALRNSRFEDATALYRVLALGKF
ncbi:hypothetical protein BKA93DRAFT_724865 [Sparassis latifolia]